MSLDRVQFYLTNTFPGVEGWCVPHIWQAIQPLYEDMSGDGKVGPVAEIGVFHGKFLLGLLLMVDAPANNFAIDVFREQRFNLDGAGEGSLERFKENLQKVEVSSASVTIVEEDSFALRRSKIEEIYESAGGFSFFSVDGCHRAEHTINDVNIACELTSTNGIIFVDDYYNPSWPGVQEGIAKMFLTSSPRFVPLLFTSGKLFLCHLSFHDYYLGLTKEFIEKNFINTRIKVVSRFGYKSLTVSPKFDSFDFLIAPAKA